MRVLDLFSGIGGFSLGLDRAGMETVAFCEIDPFCHKVLAKHWPDVPIHEDIRELNGEKYRGTIDVVCGGFPCQPFSAAGKRAGQDDDRDLWPEMFRVIREVQPAWVIGENVVGFVNMELDRTITDLESIGYAVQTFDIPACGVGAPHIRHRVWIVAHTSSSRRWEDARSPYEDESKHAGWPSAQTNIVKCDGEGSRAGGVADSDSQREQQPKREQQEGGRWSSNCGDAYRRWPVEPRVGRVVTGLPGRMDRIRALGNAVVPQVVEVLGRSIIGASNEV